MDLNEITIIEFLKNVGYGFIVILIIVAIINDKIQKSKAKVYYRDREYNALNDIKQMLNKDIQEKELEELKRLVAQKEKQLKGK